MGHLRDAQFGEVLRRMRSTAGLSQEALAERAGLSVRGISDLERGQRRTPRLETIRMLADALGLDDAGRSELIVASRPYAAGTTRAAGAASPVTRHTNLPHTLTHLIGRAREVAEITSIIRQPDVRLLTLTGPGGIGKTRLALQVGEELVDAHRDGVHLVPLVPLNSADLVIPAIAEVLGVREADGLSLQQALAAHLRDLDVLLLLDNFEHVLAATPAVHELLGSCPELKIIVTSRAALHLRMEHVYDVAPLGLPDSGATATLDDITRFDALALFVDRARMADARFEATSADVPLITAICQRLDGLPLAIELAAARVRVLWLVELQERLGHSLPVLTGGARDLPLHQQTLQSTIGWSYGLLEESSRKLFRRLAVFAGGWTLESALAVAVDPRSGQPDPDVLDGIEALIDHSLVRRTATHDGISRFGMLQTIREFGLEQLESHDEVEHTRERHAAYFLSYVRQLDLEQPAVDERARLRRVDIEYDNVRVALRWFLDGHDALNALSLSSMLRSYWIKRGHFSEARGWLDEALSIPDPEPGAERAAALYAACGVACHQSDLIQAEQFALEGLHLSRARQDDTGIATALLSLGLVTQLQDNYEEASEIYEECIALQRTLDHPKLAVTLGNLAQVEFHMKRAEPAIDLLNESIELDRAAGDTTLMASHMTDLGLILVERGYGARAHELFIEALRVHHEVGNVPKIIITIEGIAAAELQRDQPAQAAHLYGAAEALREQFDFPESEPDRWHYNDYVSQARARLGDHAFNATWSEGRSMSMDDAVRYALAHPVSNGTFSSFPTSSKR